jgi:hypothetical protein
MTEQSHTIQVLGKTEISSVANLQQIKTIFPNPQTVVDKLVIEKGANEYYWGELTDQDVLLEWKFEEKIPKRLIFIHNPFLVDDNSYREDTFKGFVVRKNESPKTLSLVGDKNKPFNIELIFEEEPPRSI